MLNHLEMVHITLADSLYIPIIALNYIIILYNKYKFYCIIMVIFKIYNHN